MYLNLSFKTATCSSLGGGSVIGGVTVVTESSSSLQCQLLLILRVLPQFGRVGDYRLIIGLLLLLCSISLTLATSLMMGTASRHRL